MSGATGDLDVLAAGATTGTVNVWWESCRVNEGETRWWALGPLLVGVQRKTREWRVGYEYFTGGDAIRPVSERSVDELETATRFIFSDPGDELRLSPALADRPVVTKPVSPLYLPPGEETMMFVSSQVWVRVEATQPGKVLLDVPSMRPSDTWLGSSTREGELCYASRTHGRLSLDDLPQQPFRAVTPLQIVNESQSELLLERIGLPVPNLSLYASQSGGLWTQKVGMRCSGDSRLAALRLKAQPPRQAGNPILITGPRIVRQEGVLIRAFGSIFS